MWPFQNNKDVEEASKTPVRKQYEEAVKRRRSASEELKKHLEELGPFDELAEFLRGVHK